MNRTIIRNGLQGLAGARRAARRGYSTEADFAQAKDYCVKQIAQSDRSAFLIRQFVPRQTQDLYDAVRALNLELVRLPESVSNPTIGQMRMQFWRESLDRTFAGNPPREPTCLLLRKALDELQRRSDKTAQNSIKYWLSRVLKTRERYMGNRPFPSLAALEEYAENTYSGLMYATLAAVPMRSVHVDHLASHIGKACGIVAVLRGIPVLAAPSPPVESPRGQEVAPRRDPVLLLPLETMAEAGVTEEEVFRKGPEAPGFQDAVFQVATRANDHLITAREMIKNLEAGQYAGHDYEHEGEEQHVYEQTDAMRDIRTGFGVLLEAVPADDYLMELQKRDFDPFAVRSSWKLPWRIWRALRKGRI